MKTFADFEIWIGAPSESSAPISADRFPVQVFSSPAGPAIGELQLNLAAPDFKQALALVCAEGPDLVNRQHFGGQLYEALFTGNIRDVWLTSLGRVSESQADGLRLRLWINPPQLSILPWELLWENDLGFLATTSDLAVSRYLPVPEPPQLPAQKQLRILIISESPPRLPAIEEAEIGKLEAAISSLGERVAHRLLRNATRTQIQDALQEDYHIFHFLGHGVAGKLALVDPDGQTTDAIEAEALAQLFQRRRSLRLVVLCACNSSQVEGELFTGVGPALIRRGVPAVVAMQYPAVSVDTAGQFSARFYAALLRGLPVDFAVNEARQALSASDHLADRDWSTPVLVMGTRNGRILDLVSPEADAAEVAWQSVATAVQDSEVARKSLAELTDRLQALAGQQRILVDRVELEDHLRDLRGDFVDCEEIIRVAGSPGGLGARFTKLKNSWTRVQQQLAPLSAFLDDRPDLKRMASIMAISSLVQHIETSLAELRLGELMTQLPQLGMQLDVALAEVREESRQALRQWQTMADTTLGRFAPSETQ